VAIVGSIFASVYSGRLTNGFGGGRTARRRATMERSMAAAYKVIGQLPAGPIADVRDASTTHSSTASKRVTGLRGYRAGRCGRRRRAAAGAGAPVGIGRNRRRQIERVRLF
jgi:hypothetical protein